MLIEEQHVIYKTWHYDQAYHIVDIYSMADFCEVDITKEMEKKSQVALVYGSQQIHEEYN